MPNLSVLLLALTAVFAFSYPASGAEDAVGRPDNVRAPVELTPAATELHRSSFVLDGHNDLPWELRGRADVGFKKLDISQPQPELHTDIDRLRRGGVGAQYWSAYVPTDTATRGESLLQTLEQIDLIHRLVARYPETFELARTADDVQRIQKSGKIASLIGIEGGHSIQNSLGVLRKLHSLGAGYMTLTHSDTLDWADAATDEPKHGGLAPFGEEVVQEMNRLGMIVDISHVAESTMDDALRVSRAPLMASHSSAFAVAQHPRNISDEILLRMRENGALVMVNFSSAFVVPASALARAEMFEVRRKLRAEFPTDDAAYENAYQAWQNAHPISAGTVHDVVDHVEHIARTAGVDHVGLGGDFDGVSLLPEQLKDVSCYPYITQELLNRGFSADDIRKILSGNMLRVMRQVEHVAKELQLEAASAR